MKNTIIVFSGDIPAGKIAEIIKEISLEACLSAEKIGFIKEDFKCPEPTIIKKHKKYKKHIKGDYSLKTSTVKLYKVCKMIQDKGLYIRPELLSEWMGSLYNIKVSTNNCCFNLFYGLRRGYFVRIKRGAYKLTEAGLSKLRSYTGGVDETEAKEL